MTINKLSMQIYTALCSIILLPVISVQAAEMDADSENNKSRFIEIGGEFQYSDNVYKLANKQRGGTTLIADIELGYQKQQENSDLKFNYFAQCGDESEDTLANNCYWIGNTSISRDIFSKNLLFNLNHTRQRYIIDPTQPNLDQNQDERDLLDVGLQWLIVYSTRHTFVLGASHNESWFNNDQNSDSNSNEGEVSWRYALNKKSQLQLSYLGSKNEFDDFDNSYQEHNIDARITRNYQLGLYSINYGNTWIDGAENNYSGAHYGLSIEALIRSHQLRFEASRVLTNSSQQIGESDELDFSKNQLFWHTQISLNHGYTLIDERLISNIRLYFSKNDNVATLNSGETKDEYRYGTNGEIDWSITDKFTASLAGNYYQADLSNGSKKKYAQTELSGRYNIIESLYIQFSTAFEKQAAMLGSPGYTELSYVTRIAFRY